MENFLAEDLFDVFDESDQKTVNDRLFTNFKRDNGEMQDEHNVKKLKTEAILEDINFDEIRSRIIVHGIQTIESCTHEVAIPPDQEYTPLETLITKKPAKEYKFVLDPFQKEAILCIENNQSVLVSAHTSAGKTVVADSRESDGDLHHEFDHFGTANY